jgi:hypothetical protein
VGLKIDHKDYLIVAEYADTDLGENFSATYSSYYVSLAKRFNDIMLHFTFNNTEQSPDSMPEYAPYRGPCEIASSYECLWENTNNLLLASATNTKAFTFGARWDLTEDVAFKVEYTDSKATSVFEKSNDQLVQFALTTIF